MASSNSTEHRALSAGDLIADKYRVGKPLGAGGMAEVYEAQHVELGTRLAIKVLRAELTRSATVVQRFSREAQAAAQLQSEHVARVIDVGKHDGVPFIVMERLEGQDLAARLRAGPLSLDQAVDHLLQAGQALSEAHARGIVHRDIKPSNLFLAQRPPDATQIKVLDFGIAKAVSSTSPGAGELTRTRDVLGSPLYMSPEQLLASSTVGPTSDVWSMGVVLQELLTGQPPFDGPSVAAIHAAILEREPRPLSIPDHQAELSAIVARCLRKDPQERYQSIQELAAVLAPFGTHVARDSLRAIQSWASVGQAASRQTASMSDAELDAAQDTAVPDSMGPAAQTAAETRLMVPAGGVTDTSWDADTDPGPVRNRSFMVALAVLALGGAVAFITLRGAPDEPPSRAAPRSSPASPTRSSIPAHDSTAEAPGTTGPSTRPSAGPSTRPSAGPSTGPSGTARVPTPTGSAEEDGGEASGPASTSAANPAKESVSGRPVSRPIPQPPPPAPVPKTRSPYDTPR